MGKAIQITDANFAEVVEKSNIVLVDFWAQWCGPCKAIAPMIDELAGEYEGKITIGKLDVDANSATSTQFGVMNIPTLLIFKNGKMVEKMVGAPARGKLVEKLNAQLNPA